MSKANDFDRIVQHGDSANVLHDVRDEMISDFVRENRDLISAAFRLAEESPTEAMLDEVELATGIGSRTLVRILDAFREVYGVS